MNILREVDGCAGGTVSVSVTASSGFNAYPRVKGVYLVL
jgi:hypothetical protein